MKISIKNIGNVKSADIDVNSITIIAGNNNSGKSTVGKVLYATATGLNLLEPQKFIDDKIESIYNKVSSLYRIIELDDEHEEQLSELCSKLLKLGRIQLDPYEKDADVSREIKREIDVFFKQFFDVKFQNQEQQIQKLYNDVINLIDVPIDDMSVKVNTMDKVFAMEFSSQISPLNNPAVASTICVKELNQNEIRLIFKEHKLISEQTTLDTSRTFSKAIYIDNPFILDNERHFPMRRMSRNEYGHSATLARFLGNVDDLYDSNSFELNDRIKKIDEIFDCVLKQGEISVRGNKRYYESAYIKSPLLFENLSTGLKSFSIINMLLKSNYLNACEYIILDEPEIHLHPDWQLRFAELVVLISKEFNLKVIVTSHSPYFIEAIELYSKKHNYFKDVRFYKTIEEEGNFVIKDSTEKLSELYASLADAFFVLEELRDSLSEGVAEDE